MADRYGLTDKVGSLKEQVSKARGKTITILGMEGVGSVLAEALCRNGYNLRIIDKGRVYREELQGQSLFIEEDVNKFKAKQAKKRLEAINPEVKIKAFHEELSEDTNYLLDSDLVLDCTNNKDVSLIVHEYCKLQEFPVIYCGTEGENAELAIQQDKDVTSKLKDYNVEENGLFVGTVHMASSVVIALAIKILAGEKVNDHYKVDSWKLKVE